MQLIGLLGGTFNPIHFGHLRMAQSLANALHLDEVRFIPSANPPHKVAPAVSAQHRAQMVQLAINDNHLFKLDTRELQREGVSYTIDTLISLREELGSNVALVLLMGSDAFSQLNSWHRWQELLNYCHIILVQRPNEQAQIKLSNEIASFLQENYTENIEDLQHKNAGFMHMQKIAMHDISATAIRHNYQHKISNDYLLPSIVDAFIKNNHLYE